ncbi:DUF932 domain-containing protein [uncultured Parabacteroides sp.]|uniref:DUF932 domain-containing protein n=1 Tax=uncultured Parabacteroides sp. TaxID=512312 RepID=UPI00259BCF57|nr:DUF932 domain-containing protein [uncultured Parabacteroides sp.]
MNNIAIYKERPAIFDFQNKSVETLSLDTLKRTHKENDIQGQPLTGIYHYQVIEQVAELCHLNGLDYQIEEIFAAQNRNKQIPGVVILPQVEAVYGEKAIESHVLRRIFTTIKINNEETPEMNTTIAIAYHQSGIQIGFGPNVKICHNQCILSPERTVSNYGNQKVTTAEMFNVVNDWLNNFSDYRINDLRILKQMKKINCSLNDTYQLIGLLTSMRVAKDSKNKELNHCVNSYPLNQSQISVFTENCLLAYKKRPNLSLWDVYNVATELYKPQHTDIPNLIPQNLSLINTLTNYYNLD